MVKRVEKEPDVESEVEEDGSMDENMDWEDMNSEIDEDENEMEKAA